MHKLKHNEILQLRYSAEELRHRTRFPIVLVLHNIRSAYNVGAMFRTADAARIAKIFLCGVTPYPPNPKIEKTALDATMTVPWEYRRSIFDVFADLRQARFTLAALEITSNSLLYCALQPHHFPLALVIGNEITGVDDEILGQVDLAVEIPMFGLKHSLNVSVATGIMVYESLRIYTTNFSRNLPSDVTALMQRLSPADKPTRQRPAEPQH